MVALLVPMVSARMKEWAYAGFAITLVSALIAHLAVGDGFDAWSFRWGPGFLGPYRISFSGGFRPAPSTATT